MDSTADPGVLFRLQLDEGDRAADHVALAALAGAAGIGHRCPVCGADDHGSPIAFLADGSPAPEYVSLARAGGRVALATSSAGRVGVDIEEIARVAASALDDVAFDGPERAMLDALNLDEGRRMRALLWSAKEAVLKAAGTGLRTDPRSLGLEPGDEGQLALTRSAAPGIRPETVELHEIDVPAGLVGVIAILRTPPASPHQSFGSAFE